MSEYAKLSQHEVAALDSLIEKVKADASFITAIIPVVVRIVPVVVRITQAVTPAIVGEATRAGVLEGPEARLLQGKVTAQDLVELRKTLVGGK